MCGISGIVSKNKILKKEIFEMNRAIRHRGPDDEGFVFFDAQFNVVTAGGEDTSTESYNTALPYSPKIKFGELSDDFKIALGHRRLSILDLSSAGHMPMCDSSENLWITYNGEVYNFLEIKAELIALGHSFQTQTDTEIILNAYKEWGTNCLDRFMGMFAFAILNRSDNSLFLARDRFGIKPLYYWISTSGSLYFGSEIKQFTASSDWRPRLNHPRAYDYLIKARTDHTKETMIKGVFHIPPGHAALLNLNSFNPITDQAIDTLNWYVPKIKEFQGSFSEAKSIFREKFFESIQMHLRADVKVGSTLSGGFDSTSIACVVNEFLKKEGKTELQNTFSAIDGDSVYSEKKWIEKVIEKINVSPHYVTPDPKEILQDVEKILWQMDEPNASLSPYLGYLVDRLARENGITVLLNGQGADEYLGGYGAFRKLQRRNALASLNVKRIKREFECNYSSAINMVLKEVYRRSYAFVFPKSYSRSYQYDPKSKKAFSCLNHDILRHQSVLKNDSSGRTDTSYYSISRNLLFSWPLPMYLRWGDRNSMVHSVEGRVPFLDHRLVEFCHGLPIEFLDTPQLTKRILLESVKEFIPYEIYHRKDKMGYVAPDERWVKQEFTDIFRDLMQNSIQFSKGIILPDAMHYFEEIISGKEKFDFVYWRLIMFGYWMKTFNVSV